ncbi:MAG: glycosyltransferase family 4 protein [Verrucomicrobia bacterium]|nr:glycosyltransferase family 4 protein [Verrucomicrobiota bacterium]
MKILQLHNLYRFTGGEDTVVHRERILLQQHGHQVVALERSNIEMDQWPLWRRALLPLRTVFSLESYRQVRKFCRTERPDVAHVHNVFFLLSPSVYYALNHEGVPIVQTCHNFRLVCTNGLFYTEGRPCERCKFGNYWHAVLHRCCYDSRARSVLMAAMLSLHRYPGRWFDRVDAFIALSEFSRRKLIEGGLPAARVFLKPNCMEKPLERGSGDGDYAIVMGRLHPEKDVQTTLEAFRHVQGLRLLVVGEGPLREPLERQAQEWGLAGVEFRGFVAGAARFELLRRARFLLLSSRVYENFSMSVLEAYAAARPVVASRIGAVAELVEDGVTGLLFEPGNPLDMAAKVRQLQSDPALVERLGSAARQKFERHYLAETNYQQLVEVYNFARERAAGARLRHD